MTRNARHPLILAAAAALLIAGSSACTPVEYGVGAGAAALAGPQVATGRNSFYWLNRAFGRSCEDFTYFDRPVRCVNDRS